RPPASSVVRCWPATARRPASRASGATRARSPSWSAARWWRGCWRSCSGADSSELPAGQAAGGQHERLHGQRAVAFDFHFAGEQGLHGGDGAVAQALVGRAVDLDGGAGPAGVDAFFGEGEIQAPAAAPLAGDLDE